MNFHLPVACCLAMLLGLTAPLAADVQDLRALVPAEPGVYVEWQDIAGTWQTALGSPLVKRVQAFPPVARWQAQQLPALQWIAGQVARELGISLAELRDEVLGGNAALAIYPHFDDKLQWDGAVVVLLESRNPDLLKKTLVGLNAANKRSGELVAIEKREHNGLEYHVRDVRRNEKESREFVAQAKQFAVWSDHEDRLLQVLDLYSKGRAAAGSKESFSSDPILLAQLAPSEQIPPLRVLVRPAVWLPFLVQAIEKASRDDAEAVPVATLVHQFAAATDYLLLTAELNDALTVRLVGRIFTERLSPDAKAAWQAISGPNKLLARVPAEALVVLTGHVDYGYFVKLATQLASGDEQKELEKLGDITAALLNGDDLFRDLIPSIGPDVGGYLLAGPSGDQRTIPADVVTALELRGSSELIRNAQRGLVSLLQVGTAVFNAQQGVRAVVHTRGETGSEVTWIEGWKDVPPEIQPAFAIADGHLWLANSPDAVQKAATVATSDSLPQATRFTHWLPADQRPLTGLAYLHLAGCRGWVKAHQPRLVQFIAAAKQVPSERVTRSLEQLDAVLAVADIALAAQSCHDEGFSAVVVVGVNAVK